MPFNHLTRVLGAIQPLSNEFLEALEKDVVLLSLPKDYKLLEVPQISNQAYFLHRGFALTYSYTHGHKQVERFWNNGQIIVSLRSFFEQVPTTEFIQLAAPSEVLCISHQCVITLMEKFSEANHLCRVILSRYYTDSCERVHSLHHEPTTARFRKLTENFPEIEQLVPQDWIASYLGIAPQSLSRMKRHLHSR